MSGAHPWTRPGALLRTWLEGCKTPVAETDIDPGPSCGLMVLEPASVSGSLRLSPAGRWSHCPQPVLPLLQLLPPRRRRRRCSTEAAVVANPQNALLQPPLLLCGSTYPRRDRSGYYLKLACLSGSTSTAEAAAAAAVVGLDPTHPAVWLGAFATEAAGGPAARDDAQCTILLRSLTWRRKSIGNNTSCCSWDQQAMLRKLLADLRFAWFQHFTFNV